MSGKFNLKTFIQKETEQMEIQLKKPAISEKNLVEIYRLGKCVFQMQLFLLKRELY